MAIDRKEIGGILDWLFPELEKEDREGALDICDAIAEQGRGAGEMLQELSKDYQPIIDTGRVAVKRLGEDNE